MAPLIVVGGVGALILLALLGLLAWVVVDLVAAGEW